MNIDDKEGNEEENIPEPIIHETENFRTAYFGKLPEEVAQIVPAKFDNKLIATLVTQLTRPDTPEVKEEVLKVLREGKSQELLVEVMAMKQYAKHRKTIIAACWECGLDFTNYLEQFVALLNDKATDQFSVIEIVTVIEEMAGPFDQKILEKSLDSIDLLSINDPLKKELLTETVARLMSFKTK